MWLKQCARCRDAGWCIGCRTAMSCRHLVAFLAIALLGAGGAGAESISVSAAVSVREAIADIAKDFEAETHDHVDLNFGASGQLAAQIRSGAPVDLFVSAANKEVDDLSKAGVVDDGTRRAVAGNELVLIVPADSKIPLASFEQLKDATVNRLAIGEPRTVPAGQYAMQVLTELKLNDALKSRLIYGSNVRQVLNYVELGEVSAGIVYATDAIQAGQKVKVVATAKPSMHEPVVLPAVVIKSSRNKALAGRFLDYLLSDKGQSVLAAHGFTRAAAAGPATVPSK